PPGQPAQPTTHRNHVHGRTESAQLVGERPEGGQRDMDVDGVAERADEVDQVALSPGQPRLVVDEQHALGHATPSFRRPNARTCRADTATVRRGSTNWTYRTVLRSRRTVE